MRRLVFVPTNVIIGRTIADINIGDDETPIVKIPSEGRRICVGARINFVDESLRFWRFVIEIDLEEFVDFVEVLAGILTGSLQM